MSISPKLDLIKDCCRYVDTVNNELNQAQQLSPVSKRNFI
jgi:hypothetical protein